LASADPEIQGGRSTGTAARFTSALDHRDLAVERTATKVAILLYCATISLR
jgi:hypothetical protein